MENLTSRPVVFSANPSHLSITAIIIVSCTIFVIIAILLFLCGVCSSSNRRLNEDEVPTLESNFGSDDEDMATSRRDAYENCSFEMRIMTLEELPPEESQELCGSETIPNKFHLKTAGESSTAF